MVKIDVVKIRCKREMNDFIRLPYFIYQNCPQYVPDLEKEVRDLFDRHKNPAYTFSQIQPFVAYRNEVPVGRIVGIINHKANGRWQTRNVRFSMIEFIDDLNVSKALIEAVSRWGQSEGMEAIHGPLGITDFDKEGMLVEDFHQIHLFFLKGESGSELSTSARQSELYDAMPWKGHLIEKFFLKTYINYTRHQENATPAFQRFMAAVNEKYGGIGNMPQSLRTEFCRQSLPLMPLTNILTFNTRATVLYVSCLVDLPLFYFAFEIVVMSVLYEYMRRRHEHMCETL